MKTAPRTILTALTVLVLSACSSRHPEAGVSYELARNRAEHISDLRYSLGFDLTDPPGKVEAHDTVSFTSAVKADLFLDFKMPESNLLKVFANGREVPAVIDNEHIVIPRRFTAKGSNVITIDFIAGEQSLNRREEFMYTLLVPDRARTLFPCFDQPDMKAGYSLSLKVPDGWCAVSNTYVVSSSRADEGTIIRFAPTEPLSTYLFSFVAGKFQKAEATRNGRTIAMYHRETDPDKTAQSSEIFGMVFDSLDWLEEYTGISYPFAKYDFIVLPDFQYGGMEHTGATLYNDRRIFLGTDPTTDELLDRASLIAHETSHMWFGDYVTMEWFNDVWTKEVFANWFAARIMRPMFPEVNHKLSDLKSYYAAAYTEDRTAGSNAIQRPLGNLQDAGLIYCNIIYDKAPVVMDMLAGKLGEDRFRQGIHEYLERFGFANATWDDLVSILDDLTDEDIASWSDTWIKEEGMPSYSYDYESGEVVQEDPFGKGRVWQQDVTGMNVGGKYWLPNLDGKAYGWFKPDIASLQYIMDTWDSHEETGRMSLLMTLYENSWHGTLDRKTFVEWCCKAMPDESNPLILSSLISYAASENLRTAQAYDGFSRTLRMMAGDESRDHESRLLAFRQYFKSACTPEEWEEVHSIWKEMKPFSGLSLSEADYTNMSYQLMIAFPDRAGAISSEQRERITNPDRLETFDFICRAASPDKAAREELFRSLLASPENRRPESRVLSALSFLCHHSRKEEALEYIIPSLETLHEIQRTGDIFFPASWCRTLFAAQDEEKSCQKVDAYLESHPEMNPLLVTKIKQALKR